MGRINVTSIFVWGNSPTKTCNIGLPAGRLGRRWYDLRLRIPHHRLCYRCSSLSGVCRRGISLPPRLPPSLFASFPSVCACLCEYMCVRVSACLCVCVCVCVPVDRRVYVRARRCVWVFVGVWACVFLCVCACGCMHVCTCERVYMSVRVWGKGGVLRAPPAVSCLRSRVVLLCLAFSRTRAHAHTHRRTHTHTQTRNISNIYIYRYVSVSIGCACAACSGARGWAYAHGAVQVAWRWGLQWQASDGVVW